MKVATFRSNHLKRGTSAVRFLTTAAFFLSVLQYLILGADEGLRIIPVFLFCFAALVYCVVAPYVYKTSAIASVLSLPIAGFICIVAVIPTESSALAFKERATIYGALMVIVLISARILVSAIGLSGILRSCYVALSISIPFVVALSFREWVASFRGATRYAPFGFHPNGIAMFAAVLVPLHIWWGLRGRALGFYRWLSVALCVGIIVASGSRSGVVELIAGCLGVFALQILKDRHRHIKRIYITICLAFLAVLLVYMQSSNNADTTHKGYLWNKMALDSRERGLNSGMSGRTGQWTSFSYTLNRATSLFGNGFRTTSEDGYMVDNGYLSAVYEIGIIPACVVFGRYLWNIGRTVCLYFRSFNLEKTHLLLYMCFICVFLLVSTVGRNFFSYGDPVSLLALCFLLARDRDFEALCRLKQRPSRLQQRNRYAITINLPSAVCNQR